MNLSNVTVYCKIEGAGMGELVSSALFVYNQGFKEMKPGFGTIIFIELHEGI